MQGPGSLRGMISASSQVDIRACVLTSVLCINHTHFPLPGKESDVSDAVLA